MTKRDKKIISAMDENARIAPQMGLCAAPFLSMREVYKRQAKRNTLHIVVIIALSVLLCASVIYCVILSAKAAEEPIEEEKTATMSNITIQHLQTDYPEPDWENEAELIAQACIAQIGTETEQQCFGYNATYVLQVLTAECGNDETLCWAVATALSNECKASGGRLSPEEAISEYRWSAEPADFISDAAMNSFYKVFLRCDIDYSVGDSTLFYNPMYTDGVPFHETQEFVTEIHGVRFFKEVDGE